jgi:hypothetical protein
VLAGAIISIMLNPVLFTLLEKYFQHLFQGLLVEGFGFIEIFLQQGKQHRVEHNRDEYRTDDCRQPGADW